LQVSDREHKNVAALTCVDHAIRKTAQTAAADALVQRLPRFGIAYDAVRRRQQLDQEGVAQARSLRFVPADSLVKLDLGDLEEPNRHGRYLQ
jgi:hypothetical protein